MEFTQEQFERFTEVMVAKYTWQFGTYPDKKEGERSVIQGVIADTLLLADGSVPLDAWEKAIHEQFSVRSR